MPKFLLNAFKNYNKRNTNMLYKNNVYEFKDEDSS